MDPNQEPQTNPEAPAETETPIVNQEVQQPVSTPETPDSQPVFDTPTAAPSETPTFFGTPAEQVTPATTPLPSVVDDVVSTTPIPTNSTPVVALAAKQTKSKLWLWVTLGAVLVIIIGLVVGYVVVKGAGDTAAKNYTAKAKTYVQDAYDASTTAAENPGDLVKSIDDIKKPQLETVFLSSLSSNYASAQTLDKEVVNKVSDIKTKLTQYANVYDIYHVVTDLKSSSAPDPSKDLGGYFKFFADAMANMLSVETAKKDVPDDIKAGVDELIVATADTQAGWQTAYEDIVANDKTKATEDYKKLLTSANTFDTKLKVVSAYYNNLAEKIKAATKDLQSYADTIK